MDYYQIWCNLKKGSEDLRFCEDVNLYLGRLKADGLIQDYRISRRKLGFGPSTLGEFNICIMTKNMTELEAAFQQVATRTGEIETLHAAVYGAVQDTTFALYRDFPDPERI